MAEAGGRSAELTPYTAVWLAVDEGMMQSSVEQITKRIDSEPTGSAA